MLAATNVQARGFMLDDKTLSVAVAGYGLELWETAHS
jgi:hypothetical protein